MSELDANETQRPFGSLGSFGPQMQVFQTHALGYKPGREVVIGRTERPSLHIPATRPTLRFPLTESLASKHLIDLWYFDPAKWPDRERVDPADYLGIRKGPGYER